MSGKCQDKKRLRWSPRWLTTNVLLSQNVVRHDGSPSAPGARSSHRVCETGDVRFGDLYGVGKQQPLDGFGTGWCRQRARISIVGEPPGQEPVRVDSRVGLDGLTFMPWHRCDNLAEYRVGLSRHHQRTDHRERARRMSMDKMRLHRKPLAADEVLARTMEVKLQ